MMYKWSYETAAVFTFRCWKHV